MGEVSDGVSQWRERGKRRGAEGAGGVVLERLVAVVTDVLEGWLRDQGLEVLFGGDVVAALGDPRGLETAGGGDIVGWVEVVNVGLEVGPACVGGVEGREEEAAAAEVVG